MPEFQHATLLYQNITYIDISFVILDAILIFLGLVVSFLLNVANVLIRHNPSLQSRNNSCYKNTSLSYTCSSFESSKLF